MLCSCCRKHCGCCEHKCLICYDLSQAEAENAEQAKASAELCSRWVDADGPPYVGDTRWVELLYTYLSLEGEDRVALADELARYAGACGARTKPTPKRAPLEAAEIEALRLSRVIGGNLPEGWGFAVLLRSFGDNGHGTYVSNCGREDMLNMLRELVVYLGSGGEFEKPETM